MVEHETHAHRIGHPVVTLAGESLEPRICRPRASHAVDDFGACCVRGHHLPHRIHVVLQIRIDRDEGIARHGEEAGEQRVLMSVVP